MKFVLLLLFLIPAAPAILPGQTGESARKAKELLDQAVAALGGDAFLSVKTARMEGRLYGFKQDSLSGLARVVEQVRYPDKRREEYGKDKDEIQIVNGDKGWTVDIHGAKALSAEEMKKYWEAESMSAFYILRYRLGEEGSTLESAGKDLWDFREVDLVRFIDGQNRTATFSLDRSSHLPLRVVWMHRDSKTRERIEETEILSNYFTSQGITAPRHILRQRNGSKIFEAFIQEGSYNIDLPDSLFTAPKETKK